MAGLGRENWSIEALPQSLSRPGKPHAAWQHSVARTALMRMVVGTGRSQLYQLVGGNMSEPRVIKKYPNRRLYDTVESRYITLGDIRSLVMEKVDFVVVDKKTNVDITRSILLQVIAEHEHLGDPMMTQDFLAQVIRSYGGTMQTMVGNYLEQSLRLFTNQQAQMRDRLRSMVGLDPMANMATVAHENLQRWQQMQEAFMQSFVRANPAGRGNHEDESPKA